MRLIGHFCRATIKVVYGRRVARGGKPWFRMYRFARAGDAPGARHFW